MREIKFRAWGKKQNRYYEVRGLQYDDGKLDGIYVVDGTVAGIPNVVVLEPKDVVLEQYTGAKDQYGKEVCEGDIVKVAERVEGYVTQDMDGRWIILGDDRKPVEGCITLGELEKIPELNLRTILATEYCSIVGNIHENPELVGDKDVTNTKLGEEDYAKS